MELNCRKKNCVCRVYKSPGVNVASLHSLCLYYCAWHYFFSHLLCFEFIRELGVHVDGFIAAVAHTHVVGSSKVSIALSLCCFFGGYLSRF